MRPLRMVTRDPIIAKGDHMMMVLDHVAIAAEDLASAEAELTATHGLRFQGGGQHFGYGHA